jgi:FemAB-related protein (PEP-CTERM system-associated)
MSAWEASLLGRSEADTRAWDAYVLGNASSSGYHLAGWRRVIEDAFGHRTCYVKVEGPEKTLRGVAPLVLLASRGFGRFLVSLPFVNYGGPIADAADVRALLERSIVEHAKALKAEHVELRHEQPVETSWLPSHRKVSMRLALPDTYEELSKAFPSKLRSQIRRAQKEGMVASVGGREHLDAFYAVFSRCMRDLGTPVYAKRFFAKILEVFPDDAKICVVTLGGTPVAGGFLYGYRTVLEIPWAASDKRFNRLAPNMLLYATVLEHACRQGFRTFDFGRSSPDSGTYRFKAQWGAKPIQLHWYYWLESGRAMPELNPQNPKYALAIRMWQRLPLIVTNAIGPHIVKHLP